MDKDKLLVSNDLYEFGIFQLDTEAEQLFARNERVKVAPKVFDCLVLLVRGGGNLVSKDEFFKKVWTDTFVEDSALSYAISQLRKTLAKYDAATVYIETVPRRGFRFQAEIRKVAPPVSPPANDEILLERHQIEEVWIEESIEDAPASHRLPKPFLNTKYRWPAIALILLLMVFAGGWVFLRKMDNSRPNTVSGNSNFANGNAAVITDLGFPFEKARAVAVQEDGKIVIGGWAGENEAVSDFALTRYQADGSIDKSFGNEGKIVTRIGPDSDVIYDLAIQPDGKIIAAGVSFQGKDQRRFCLVRYKPDGGLDAAFDGDGIVTFNVGTTLRDTAYSVALQPDGRIIAAGSASNIFDAKNLTVGQNDFGLARLNPDGSPDTEFGENGRVSTHFGLGVDIGYDVALQTDGKIVVSGSTTNGSNNDFALARYNQDGTPDETFGVKGRVTTDFFGEDDTAFSMTLQPDGRILLTGYSLKNTQADFSAARYLTDGSLDNSFNGNGKITIDLENGYDVAFGIKVQPDGRIVIGGQSNVKQSPKFAVARIFADGQIDRTLYQTGTTSIAVKERNEAWALALHPDNYALLAGNSGNGKSFDFALARFALD